MFRSRPCLLVVPHQHHVQAQDGEGTVQQNGEGAGAHMCPQQRQPEILPPLFDERGCAQSLELENLNADVECKLLVSSS